MMRARDHAAVPDSNEGGMEMSWLVMLGIAVVFVALAVLPGIQPKGARPVERSKMISAARFVLFVAALLLAFFAFRARSGH